ncbi:Ppx/GppA family phosphatase [Andreprevotia chitinilytica]|uniref:Ppx/GppA family phosphatase n=1 Tax=Andreprevotia chitinilytica TaxID=396808 RepID=UPI0006904D81|nr:Ppx/GppA family phosphatase [Andreprevotia chitinilytica]
MPHASHFAAVDLGSNSFRLQIARNDHGRPTPLITLKETVRLAAALDEKHYLRASGCDEALAALGRFSSRLVGLRPSHVRAVATNTFRIARNIDEFLPRAEAALGFPIDIIDGYEEARLIYLGAAHSLPGSTESRLVVDIGGGSTELVVGRGFVTDWMSSVQLGCVTWSKQYFADGVITAERLATAEAAAKAAVVAQRDALQTHSWKKVIGTSGTARSLADVAVANRFSPAGLSADSMARIRAALLAAGHADKVTLQGVRVDRRPVLAGGFAIMAALFDVFGIEHMDVTLGGLRDGVMYDLLQRQHGERVRRG